MTRYEAKQELNKGGKVRHIFFTPYEYLHRSKENGQLLDENNIALNETMYWDSRESKGFDHNWSIIE
jgi:hypothetical protein